MSQDAANHRKDNSAPLAGFRIVSGLTFFSRILGMFRDVAMAATFGAGPVMDAFSVAFRIPNLARRLFGEGAQTSAFLPAFLHELEHAGKTSAQQLASGMFWSLAAILTVIVLVCEAVLFGYWLLVDSSPDVQLLTELLILLIPYLLFICLAALQSAVLHSLQRFAVPALLPILLNIIWLLAIPIACMGTPHAEERIRLVAAGILIGGLVQLVVSIKAAAQSGYPLGKTLQIVRNKLWPIYAAMVPILFGISITQINTVLDSLIAWGLAPSSGPAGDVSRIGLRQWILPHGTASALYFGQRMYQFPLGVFGVALGTILFPRLALHAQRSDRTRFLDDLRGGLRLTICIGGPAGLGLMLLARPITALLFQHGRFQGDDTELTAMMILAYGSAVWAFVALLVVSRAFYALGDRITPLRMGLIAVAANVILDIVLLPHLGGPGLAWATSGAAVFQALFSIRLLERKLQHSLMRPMVRTLIQTAIATLAMSAMVEWTLPRQIGNGMAERVWATGLPTLAGGTVYLLTASLIGLKTPWNLIRHGRID